MQTPLIMAPDFNDRITDEDLHKRTPITEVGPSPDKFDFKGAAEKLNDNSKSPVTEAAKKPQIRVV